ncbi:MAG: hypothetical protein RSD95_08535 [Clostridia bacterium]
MSTNVRSEISTKNRYWISKHRYYELRHFCLQYPEWKRRYASLDGLPSHASLSARFESGGTRSDPTAMYAEVRLYFYDRMKMVEDSANESAGHMGALLLRAVTEGTSYEHLRAQEGVPCCKDAWYAVYRRFFWLLDKARQ